MSVWKSNGVWTFKVTVVDAFGNKRQVRKQSIEWNKEAAQKAERLFLIENTNDSTMPFSKLATEHFEWYKNHAKKSSYRTRYSEYINRIAPYFESIAIDRINNKMIMAWQSLLLKSDRSENYMLACQTLLKEILEYGVSCAYLSDNPFKVKFVHLKKEDDTENVKIHYLTMKDFEKFIKFVDNRQDEILYNLLFWGGLRIGEALALQISDYNRNTGVLNVSKTMSGIDKEVTSPKSTNSKRRLTLDKGVQTMIDELLDNYAKYPDCVPSRFIFGYDESIYYSTFRYRHEQYIKKAMIPYFKIHSLRHSCVSTLISIGANPVFIAKRLGHSPDMTLKIYAHLFPDDDVKMAKKQETLKKSRKLGNMN